MTLLRAMFVCLLGIVCTFAQQTTVNYDNFGDFDFDCSGGILSTYTLPGADCAAFTIWYDDQNYKYIQINCDTQTLTLYTGNSCAGDSLTLPLAGSCLAYNFAYGVGNFRCVVVK